MHAETLAQVCLSLRTGGVIAYPTEAVWGLGCDPFNGRAVGRILQMKGRDEGKGLILVAASIGQIQPLLTGLEEARLAELKRTWPGPVTWLVPDTRNLIPPWIKGSHRAVALRVSAHPLVRALCEGYGGPIVSTSANREGEPPLDGPARLQAAFGSELDFIVPGELGGQERPSEIRDLLTGETVRA